MKNIIYNYELYYSLSFFFEDWGATNYFNKLSHFSNFIENLVFSESLFLGLDGEESDSPKASLYKNLFKSLKLNEVIDPINLEYDFNELNTIREMHLRSESLLSDAETQSILDLAPIINYNPNLEVFKSLVDFDYVFFSADLDGVESLKKIVNDPEGIAESISLLSGKNASTPSEEELKKFQNITTLDFANMCYNVVSGMLLNFLSALTELHFEVARNNAMTFLPMKNLSTIVNNKPFHNYANKISFAKLNELISEEELALHDYYVDKFSFNFELPLIFNYIVSKSSSKKEIIEIALQLRESADIRKFRNWCKKLDEAIRNGNRKEAFNMNKECQEFIKDLQRRKNTNRKVSFRLSFPPAIMIDLKESDFIDNKHKFSLLKNIYNSTNTNEAIIRKLMKMK